MNPLCTPNQIFLSHLLDQTNRVSRSLGTTATVTGFEFPRELKASAMPAEQGIRFQDQESVFPMLNAADEQDEPEAIQLSEARCFDLPVQDEKLPVKAFWAINWDLLLGRSAAMVSAIE